MGMFTARLAASGSPDTSWHRPVRPDAELLHGEPSILEHIGRQIHHHIFVPGDNVAPLEWHSIDRTWQAGDLQLICTSCEFRAQVGVSQQSADLAGNACATISS